MRVRAASVIFLGELGNRKLYSCCGETSQKVRIEPEGPRLGALIAKEREIDGSRSDCRCMRQHPMEKVRMKELGSPANTVPTLSPERNYATVHVEGSSRA